MARLWQVFVALAAMTGCAPAKGPSDLGGRLVDVGAWMRQNVGADGERDPPFCRELRGAFPATAVEAPPVHIVFALYIPRNDVSAAYAESQIVSAAGEIPAQAAAEQLRARTRAWSEAFRSSGGRATTAAAAVELSCSRTSEAPNVRKKLQWLSNLP